MQVIHDLKSDRNAQRVMKQLEPYVNVFKEGQNIYYLNKKGRLRVDCEKVRKKTHNVNHYLMRNDLYIQLGMPPTWRNEIRIKNGDIIVVTDAIFKTDRDNIVEIDNTQTMRKNRIKIEKYRRLIERNAFKKPPNIYWVTTTDNRKRKLTELCEGLRVYVYLQKDFK